MSANFAKYKFRSTSRRFFFFTVRFSDREPKRVIVCRYITSNAHVIAEHEGNGRSCYCEWIDIADHILRYYKYASYMRLSNRDLRIGSFREDIYQIMTIFCAIRDSTSSASSLVFDVPWKANTIPPTHYNPSSITLVHFLQNFTNN